MTKKIYYVTYQSFPADTANSLQTISNIKSLVQNDISIHLYFPLREKESSDSLKKLQEYYEFDENFTVKGIVHNYPHGKFKYFKKFSFHLSHYLWTKKVVRSYFDNNLNDTFFTRSDWVAYFLAKQGSNVVFECHQTSRLRSIILKRIGSLKNVKVIFLNENLRIFHKHVTNAKVLHNGVESTLFDNLVVLKKTSKIRKLIFVGNTLRFKKDRGNFRNYFLVSRQRIKFKF